MKKTFCLLMALCMILSLAACGPAQQPASAPTALPPATPPSATPAAATPPAATPAIATAAPSPAPAAGIDNDNVNIVMMIQEYDDGNIAEIPMLRYDLNPAAFPETGGKNPEIELINSAISDGILQDYNHFVSSAPEGKSIVIMTFPFQDERYVQIIMTHIQLPGTEEGANIWTYVFDKKENRYITLDDTLSELNVTEAAVEERARELFITADGTVLESAKPTGFFIVQEPDPEPLLFLEAWILSEEDGMPWATWLMYDPYQDALFESNPLTDFDPAEWPQMVAMDPPLSYQRYDR